MTRPMTRTRTCRGCAGTGVSVKTSPRELQVATQTIYLAKRDENGKQLSRCHVRVDAWEGIGGVHTGRLAMSGPLGHVIEHMRKREQQGYQVEAGCPNVHDLKPMLCPWCGGFGVTGILTAHTMEEALEKATTTQEVAG